MQRTEQIKNRVIVDRSVCVAAVVVRMIDPAPFFDRQTTGTPEVVNTRRDRVYWHRAPIYPNKIRDAPHGCLPNDSASTAAIFAMEGAQQHSSSLKMQRNRDGGRIRARDVTVADGSTRGVERFSDSRDASVSRPNEFSPENKRMHPSPPSACYTSETGERKRTPPGERASVYLIPFAYLDFRPNGSE